MASDSRSDVVYHMRPLITPYSSIDLPTCMYKLNSIYSSDRDSSSTERSSRQQETTSTEDMQTRLSQTIKWLDNIKSEVVILKSMLNLGDKVDLTVTNQEETEKRPRDIVVKASPDYPPYSIWIFLYFLKEKLKTQLVTYTHSSLKSLPERLKPLSGSKKDGKFDVTLTVIWKDTGKNPEMMVDPTHGAIEAEVNVARYLSRLLSPGYDGNPSEAFQIDYWLELAHSLVLHGSNKDRHTTMKNLNSHFAENCFLIRDSLSIADIIMWSTILKCGLQHDLPVNVKKWWSTLMDVPMFGKVAACAN